MKRLLVLLALLVASGDDAGLRADSDARRPIPRAVASSDGAYFLLVVPVSERRIDWMWTAYAMGETGAFKEVWSSDGVYSREVFLADDGIHVACLESWPTGHRPENDVVIAVFKYGSLMKGYRATELVRDTSKLEHSASHYRWLAEWPLPFARGNTVYFTTIDGQPQELNMTSGRVTPRLR